VVMCEPRLFRKTVAVNHAITHSAVEGWLALTDDAADVYGDFEHLLKQLGISRGWMM